LLNNGTYICMFSLIKKIHHWWHNKILILMYDLYDTYLVSCRTRALISKILVIAFIILLSIFLYLTITEYIPNMSKSLYMESSEHNTAQQTAY